LWRKTFLTQQNTRMSTRNLPTEHFYTKSGGFEEKPPLFYIFRT